MVVVEVSVAGVVLPRASRGEETVDVAAPAVEARRRQTSLKGQLARTLTAAGRRVRLSVDSRVIICNLNSS